MEQTPSSSGNSPELPSVSLSPDREKGVSSSPEVYSGGVHERQEQSGEPALTAEHSSATPTIPVVAVPPVAPPVANDGMVTQPVTNSPTVANDDDLIEKEWVDKAKRVLAETRDDPYRREQEVTRLQEDYLMKRYGRKLGSLQ